jgi:N-acetylneuraminic acid mutarotase
MNIRRFPRATVTSRLITLVASTLSVNAPFRAANPGFGWSTPTSLPAPRSGAAVAVGHDGNIYVFGGTNGVTEDYNSLFVYHPRGNSWSMGATMPFAVEGNAAVTLPDGRIMVIGGTGCHITQQCTTYKTVEVYDPKLHSWCLLAPMRTSHYRFPAVLGPDGRVYAIGGWNGREAIATVEAYSIRANTWTTVTSLPQAEESTAAVVIRH